MASPVLVTPESNSKDKSSRHYLVVWINNLLKTQFKDVRQMGSGACHCQMMDLVVPGSVDMTQVKFDVQSDDDCMHNFGLLCKAFDKSSITK
ncbi:microtubule-associated protein RP/EB family member 2-like, partial [Notothenia coriiceps]|uniref:Microtubule-associated protein RP/EB family member 2-like n=2 Tax=Notothenioidei TaxID=8205 RepID=A0A6I9PBL3_9TELE